jgi:DNA-binding NarL/FixJ family response regulator
MDKITKKMLRRMSKPRNEREMLQNLMTMWLTLSAHTFRSPTLEDQELIEMIHRGVDGLVSKHDTPAKYEAALRTAMAGAHPSFRANTDLAERALGEFVREHARFALRFGNPAGTA